MSRQAPSAARELEPVGLTPIGDGRQERKSAETRQAILEATVECLARYGYSRTTNALICEIAKISRGAMLHHYATRPELIVAVTEYSFYKHLKSFSAAIHALTEEERVDINTGIAIDWRHFLSREYQAYLELHIAARTDESLRKIYTPRARHHDRVWKDELLHIFPEWSGNLRKLELARRLVRSVLEGMAMNRDIWNDPEAEGSLLGFLADLMQLLRKDKLSFPPPDRFPLAVTPDPPPRRSRTRSKG